MSQELYAKQIASSSFDAAEARFAQDALDREHSKAETKSRAFELRLAVLQDLHKNNQSKNEATADTRDSRDSIVKEITERKDREFTERIEGLEATASDKDDTINQLTEDLQASNAKATELERSLSQAETALAAATDKLESIENNEKTASRKQQLLEAGLSDTDAASGVSRFSGADDSIFSEVVSLYKNSSQSLVSSPSLSPSPSLSSSPTLSLDDPVDTGGETMSDLVQGFNDEDATIEMDRPAANDSPEADLTENSGDADSGDADSGGADSGDLGFQIDPS